MNEHLSKTGESPFFEWRNISVALTARCNLRCKMCPVVNRSTSSLTREQAMDIAEFACSRHAGQVLVGGGEPTLMPYFWDFMDLLAGGGVKISLLTNAYRLTEEQIRRLAAYPDLLVNVSVDGVGEVHDSIRGPGAFEATTKNIQRLLDCGCHVAVNTVIQRSNFRTMKDLYEWFAPFPLEWHGFQYAEYGGHEEYVAPEDIAESLAVLEELLRLHGGDRQRLGLSAAMIEKFRIWFAYPEIKTYPGLGCAVARRQITIAESGVVAPCWHYIGWPKDGTFNVQNRRLRDIVDSPEYRSAVEHVIGPGGCAGCSTLCYCWDTDFYRKLFHPPAHERIKHYLIKHFPHATARVSKMRHTLLP